MSEMTGENLPDPLDTSSVRSENTQEHPEGKSEAPYSPARNEREAEIFIVPEKSPIESESRQSSTIERIFERIRSWTSRNSVKATSGDLTTTDGGTSDEDVDVLMRMSDTESRITKLLDLALVKGPVHAVTLARRIDDAYTLDRTHDSLADDLADKLRERGLLPETEK